MPPKFPQIQALEGLQDSVNLCKSSFNPGPVVNHHYQEKTLDDPHHSSRDCGNTRRTFTSQEDDGLVNLMTEREFWLNFQATQEQSLNYAHAICTLLLSALSDLDDSRLKSQVSSLANDVVSAPCLYLWIIPLVDQKRSPYAPVMPLLSLYTLSWGVRIFM